MAIETAAARPARGRARVAEFQRSRVLRAARAVASERGYDSISATAVVAHAGVSRKTFYDYFDSREDCFLAVLEETFAELAAHAAPAYETRARWSARMRAALTSVLAFLEGEQSATLALSYLLGYGPHNLALRGQVLEQLRRLVDQARTQARGAREELSPLTAELLVGAALTVVHRRAQQRPAELMGLLNPLMWLIVLPYLGPAAAASELKYDAPTPPQRFSSPAVDSPPHLEMRLTYRTARVLESICRQPGLSNAEVAELAGVTDPGQISKLLARLARLQLIENTGLGKDRGAANAWRATDSGEQLESALRRKSATTGD